MAESELSQAVPASGLAALPGWARQIAGALPNIVSTDLSVLQPPPGAGPARHAAVLMLFGPGADGRGGVLLTRRASKMRSHAGQVAFPGGSVDPGDPCPAAAAIREANEETGLDPAGVDLMAVLPPVYLPPSHFDVTPVVAWWREPGPVWPAAPAEVDSVVVASVPGMLAPANRFSTALSRGRRGPGFEVDGLFVWGFTAGLLSKLFALSGLEKPWDRSVVRPIP